MFLSYLFFFYFQSLKFFFFCVGGLYRFHHQRVPLVILVCGTACVGKSTIATQLAQRLNLPNVLHVFITPSIPSSSSFVFFFKSYVLSSVSTDWHGIWAAPYSNWVSFYLYLSHSYPLVWQMMNVLLFFFGLILVLLWHQPLYGLVSSHHQRSS